MCKCQFVWFPGVAVAMTFSSKAFQAQQTPNMCPTARCLQSLSQDLADVAEPSVMVMAPAPASSSGAGNAQPKPKKREGGGRLLETTQNWHGFKFTQLNLQGAFNGWEVRCKLHEPSGVLVCRKQVTVGKRGSREDVERKLKYWCVSADQYPSRDTHVHCGPISLEDLPTLAELESMAEGD